MKRDIQKPFTSKLTQNPTCGQCRYFHNYNEPNHRGWCKKLDHYARTYHEQPLSCQIELESEKRPQDNLSISVHIISKQLEEQDGYPMPSDERVVEIKVAEVSLEAVEEVLSKFINLDDYIIFSFWQTEIEDEYCLTQFKEF